MKWPWRKHRVSRRISTTGTGGKVTFDVSPETLRAMEHLAELRDRVYRECVLKEIREIEQLLEVPRGERFE